jgi:hypothetical protein
VDRGHKNQHTYLPREAFSHHPSISSASASTSNAIPPLLPRSVSNHSQPDDWRNSDHSADNGTIPLTNGRQQPESMRMIPASETEETIAEYAEFSA